MIIGLILVLTISLLLYLNRERLFIGAQELQQLTIAANQLQVFIQDCMNLLSPCVNYHQGLSQSRIKYPEELSLKESSGETTKYLEKAMPSCINQNNRLKAFNTKIKKGNYKVQYNNEDTLITLNQEYSLSNWFAETKRLQFTTLHPIRMKKQFNQMIQIKALDIAKQHSADIDITLIDRTQQPANIHQTTTTTLIETTDTKSHIGPEKQAWKYYYEVR